MIEYRINPLSPEAHLFGVVISISNPAPEGQIVTLPAWIPGSYMIRDFARNIISLSAECMGIKVSVRKIDKQTWQCSSCEGELVLRYEVYAWDLSVRSAHLDTTHGYFNGTSLFLRVRGKESEPCRVDIRRPLGIQYQDWRLATTLQPDGVAFLEFGRYRARDYEDLIDHPVEMGCFGYASIQVEGVPHEFVITGRQNADLDRICKDLEPICRSHIDLFGGLPKMDRYLFMVTAVGDGYGGLEHRSSTSLICKRDALPLRGDEDISEGYRQFLGLCSHEYFHLWNVKRIRPRVFKEADLSKEVYSSLLWAFEGITSYYDDLGLVRSGCIDSESYLELLAQNMTRVHGGSGRLKQTVSESSFDTWTKFYKQDENAPNAIVSYYSKGALVALALDLIIRKTTGSRRSLDDVMRNLWRRFGLSDIGVADHDIEKIASEVAGKDLTIFFDAALRSTADLPLAEMLGYVGVGLDIRPAKSTDDKGGLRQRDNKNDKPVPILGARHKTVGGDTRLTSVLAGSPAQRSGLSAGDVIFALNEIRVFPGKLDQMVARTPIGSDFIVHAFRRDELAEFKVRAEPAPDDTCDLWLVDDIDNDTSGRRQSWLTGKSCNQ